MTSEAPPPGMPVYALWFVNILGAEYGPFSTKENAQQFYYKKYMSDEGLRTSIAASQKSCPSCED